VVHIGLDPQDRSAFRHAAVEHLPPEIHILLHALTPMLALYSLILVLFEGGLGTAANIGSAPPYQLFSDRIVLVNPLAGRDHQIRLGT